MPRKRDARPGRIGNFWLSQRPNSPVWCRTWFDARTRQTKRASLSTASFQQAELELAAWITNNGAMRDEKPQEVALETCLLRYQHHQAKHLRSADQARYALKRWSDFFPGALVSEVTPARQRDFVAAMRSEGLSNGYIRRTLAVGQAALHRAHREGEISAVPYIDLRLAPEGEPRDRLMTDEEARRLFEAAEQDHVRLYMLLAFGTAARPGAILDLTSFQIDPHERTIKLNPPGRAQTKKRRPTIAMCETLVPYLRSLPPGPVIRYNGRRIKSIRPAFGRLKARARRQLRDDAAREARRLRRIGARGAAGSTIEDAKARGDALLELTPYTIRHTVASELRRRGVSPWELAGLLGHSSGYKTTERYAQYAPDHMANAVRAIDDYFADLGVAQRPLGGQISTPLRVSSVLAQKKRAQPMPVKPLSYMVEPDGIEPTTSTMPL